MLPVADSAHLLIMQHMTPVYLLAGVAGVAGDAPDAGELEIFGDILVDLAGQLVNRAVDREDEGFFLVGGLAGLLGVDADDVQHDKYASHQLVQPLAGGGRHRQHLRVFRAKLLQYGERTRSTRDRAQAQSPQATHKPT